MFDFAAKRRWFLLTALIIMIIGAVLAFTPGGLRLGWDFKGGFQVLMEPYEGIIEGDVASKLDELGYGGFTGRIQETGGDFLIRMGDLGEDDQAGPEGRVERDRDGARRARPDTYLRR